MPIPISHQHVDQPGTQVRARVDSFVVAPVEPLEQRQRVGNLLRTVEPVLDPLFQETDHAGIATELGEAWIVGQDRQLRRGMENVYGVEQRRDHQRSVGLRGARFVLIKIANQ